MLVEFSLAGVSNWRTTLPDAAFMSTKLFDKSDVIAAMCPVLEHMAILVRMYGCLDSSFATANVLWPPASLLYARLRGMHRPAKCSASSTASF